MNTQKCSFLLLLKWLTQRGQGRPLLADLARGPVWKAFIWQSNWGGLSHHFSQWKWSTSRKFLVLLKWPSIPCQNTIEMDFLQSFAKELSTHQKFSIKSVDVHLGTKMCDLFFLLDTNLVQTRLNPRCFTESKYNKSHHLDGKSDTLSDFPGHNFDIIKISSFSSAKLAGNETKRHKPPPVVFRVESWSGQARVPVQHRVPMWPAHISVSLSLLPLCAATEEISGTSALQKCSGFPEQRDITTHTFSIPKKIQL